MSNVIVERRRGSSQTGTILGRSKTVTSGKWSSEVTGEASACLYIQCCSAYCFIDFYLSLEVAVEERSCCKVEKLKIFLGYSQRNVPTPEDSSLL